MHALVVICFFMLAWSKGMCVRFLLFWDVSCVTSQKSEDLIYSAAEAWKHANYKYVLLFYSACSWTYSSPFCLIFFGCFHLYSFVCLAISWQFYPFLKLWCVSLAIFLLFGKELISWNISLLFALCLLLSCFLEITRVILKPVCENDVSSC
jgi:hypothetical protein